MFSLIRYDAKFADPIVGPWWPEASGAFWTRIADSVTTPTEVPTAEASGGFSDSP